MDKEENRSKPNVVRTRHVVHITFFVTHVFGHYFFNAINDSSVVGMIFGLPRIPMVHF
jgi:hypothetical protein